MKKQYALFILGIERISALYYKSSKYNCMLINAHLLFIHMKNKMFFNLFIKSKY